MTTNPLLLAVSDNDFGFYISLAGMATGIIFGGLGMYFHHKRQAMWHETARIALEKGQPVPPGPDRDSPSGLSHALTEEKIRANRIRGYLLGGTINVAVGAGLYLALMKLSPNTAYFAAIPGFIGVALLFVALLDLLLTRKSRN